jgi:RNA polymerase sigma-70 factor (ECF subfamily)
MNENTNYVTYLVNLAKTGRKRAYVELAEINVRNVFTISLRLYSDIEFAKKNSIRTLLKGWEKLSELKVEESFAIWIKKLAVRYAIDELLRSNLSIADEKKKNNIDKGDELLENLINNLPLEERIIFVLHDLEGFSYNEVNSFFSILVKDEIKSKLISTREYLMEQLEK